MSLNLIYRGDRPAGEANNLTAAEIDANFRALATAIAALQGGSVAAPTIDGFLPIKGAQGSTVVLTGTGLIGTTLVSVNSAAVASFTVNSATQITAVLSANQATGKIRVTTPGGTAVSSSNFIVEVANPSLAGYHAALFGNSIIAGQDGSFQDPYIADVQQHITDAGESDALTFGNYAVGGTDSTQVFGRMQDILPGIYDATKKKFIVVFGEGYNGLRKDANRTAQQEFDVIKAAGTYAKSLGPNVVFITQTPPEDNYRLSPAPLPNFESRRQELAVLLRAARDAGETWLDALADITAETVIDSTNSTLSGDGVHLTVAGQFLYARRWGWATRQALYATSQPAPILKGSENYIDGAVVLSLSKPSGNHFVNTNGVLTLDGTAVAGYGNTGVDKYYSPANDTVDAEVYTKIQNGDSDVVVGFDDTSGVTALETFDYPFWISGSFISVIDNAINGNAITINYPAVNGNYLGLKRKKTTGVVTLRTSPDGKTNWTTLYTWTNPSTAALYVKGDGFGPTGQISFLQGVGLTLRAGESATGEGAYNGAIRFEVTDNNNTDLAYDANGNITGTSGGWGRRGRSTSYYLAANSSGGIGMTAPAATDNGDAFIGITEQRGYLQGYTSLGFRAGFYFSGGIVRLLSNGSISNTGIAYSAGMKFRAYRNRDTNAIKLFRLLVGANEWEPIADYTFSSNAAMDFICDVNGDTGLITQPMVYGASVFVV